MFRLNERAFYVVLAKVSILIIANKLNDLFIILATNGALFRLQELNKS